MKSKRHKPHRKHTRGRRTPGRTHHSNSVARNQERERIQAALRRITEIKPHIHRIHFSSPYSLKDIRENLGNVKVPANSKKRAAKFGDTYRRLAYLQLPTGRVTVLFDSEGIRRKDPRTGVEYVVFPPPTRLLTYGNNLELLFQLGQALPGLLTSYCEYAVDLYCGDPDAVSDLFFVLRRHAYVPYGKKTAMQGGEYNGYREPRTENAVYKVYCGKARHVKFYERGDDDSGWPWDHSRVNRVRLELGVRRRSVVVKRHVNTIGDLLASPKFHQVFFPDPNGTRDAIKFRNFCGSPHLPKPWEDYTAEDEDGNFECFEEEYLQGKATTPNICQYMKDATLFKGFTERIKQEILWFDEDWGKRSIALRKGIL
jgi:hypothetical protein